MKCPECGSKYVTFLTLFRLNDKEMRCCDCGHEGSMAEFYADEKLEAGDAED